MTSSCISSGEHRYFGMASLCSIGEVIDTILWNRNMVAFFREKVARNKLGFTIFTLVSLNWMPNEILLSNEGDSAKFDYHTRFVKASAKRLGATECSSSGRAHFLRTYELQLKTLYTKRVVHFSFLYHLKVYLILSFHGTREFAYCYRSEMLRMPCQQW